MCVNRLIPLGIQQGAGPSLDMKRVSTDPCDTEGCTNGDATERRSAYAKASAYAEASAFAEATADRTSDKLRESSGWNRLRRGYGGSSALLEYAVMHNDEAEAARLRAELCRLVEKV